MIIPDICNVLSTSGKEFSLSHWYSPIIDSWVTKIEVQRKHLFQIFRIYWIDSLFNMQVFWDLRMQWSNCPYFVAKKDLHWIYLVEKGKSGYSCQDAKFRSTPRQGSSVSNRPLASHRCPVSIRVGMPGWLSSVLLTSSPSPLCSSPSSPSPWGSVWRHPEVCARHRALSVSVSPNNALNAILTIISWSS